MSKKCNPIVTRWYQRVDTDEIFEVIAVDAVDGIIDIQNVEGDVEELAIKKWSELELRRIRSPNWNDRFSMFERDGNLRIANSHWDRWQHAPA